MNAVTTSIYYKLIYIKNRGATAKALSADAVNSVDTTAVYIILPPQKSYFNFHKVNTTQLCGIEIMK
jgi:hypothetical protein